LEDPPPKLALARHRSDLTPRAGTAIRQVAVKIVVWNVNGIRSCAARGFSAWLSDSRPAVAGIQEIRAHPEQIDDGLNKVRGYRVFWNPAERPGYSGVGLFTRLAPLSLETALGIPAFDSEGRLQVAEFEDWVFFNVYFPNGSGKDRDNSRVPFKLEFYEAVLERALRWVSRGKGVVIRGDFNTAHREIDLANRRSNQKTSGFLPVERKSLDRYLSAGFVDVFRERHPGEAGHCTWWCQLQGCRERNIGWRVDDLLVSRNLHSRVRRAWILSDVPGSDHCPVGIDLVTRTRAGRPSARSRSGSALQRHRDLDRKIAGIGGGKRMEQAGKALKHDRGWRGGYYVARPAAWLPDSRCRSAGTDVTAMES
jgi:exodeoxyribonuclease-3